MKKPKRTNPNAGRKKKAPELLRITRTFSIAQSTEAKILAFAAQNNLSNGEVLDRMAKKLKLATVEP